MSTPAATPPTHYHPSGRVAWHAPIKVLVFGGLGAAAVAAVYTLVIRYNPLVYFSCLATMAFGVLVGAVAAAACEAGKSRSRAFNAASGFVLGVLALWFHWLMWTWLMFDDGGQTLRHLATSGPAGWSDFLSYTADHRHLSIGKLGSDGAEESPGFMMFTWVAEAAAVLLLATLVPTTSMKPFSEKAMQWVKTDWAGEFHISPDTPLEAPQVEQRIAREGLDWLAALHANGPVANDKAPGVRLKVTCESAPDDPACAWVSLDKVTQRGEKGKVNATLVKHRLAPAASYARLLAALRAPVAPPAQAPAAPLVQRDWK